MSTGISKGMQRRIERAFVVGLVEGGCWVSDKDGSPLTERFKFDGDRVSAKVVRDGLMWCIRDEQAIEYPTPNFRTRAVRVGESLTFSLPPEP